MHQLNFYSRFFLPEKILLDKLFDLLNNFSMNFCASDLVAKETRMYSISSLIYRSLSIARSPLLLIHYHAISSITQYYSLASCARSIRFSHVRFILPVIYHIPFYFLPPSCFLTKELNYNDLYNQRLRYAFLFSFYLRITE